jgi:hypothetical protein
MSLTRRELLGESTKSVLIYIFGHHSSPKAYANGLGST